MGQLDYDRNYGDSSETFPTPSTEEIVHIRITYPSRRFGEENNDFSKRHECMQADADEHYKLLVDMQISDPLFDKMLLDNHNRKRKVEKILGESKNWARFIK